MYLVGVKVLLTSLICGADTSLGDIQNCTIKDSLLKKKHISGENLMLLPVTKCKVQDLELYPKDIYFVFWLGDS
jgi:hypothetical protein